MSASTCLLLDRGLDDFLAHVESRSRLSDRAPSGTRSGMVPAVGGSGQHLTDDEKFAESFERALIRADAFLASRPELDDESMSAMLLSVRR